jgi:hypothetical protein
LQIVILPDLHVGRLERETQPQKYTFRDGFGGSTVNFDGDFLVASSSMEDSQLFVLVGRGGNIDSRDREFVKSQESTEKGRLVSSRKAEEALTIKPAVCQLRPATAQITNIDLFTLSTWVIASVFCFSFTYSVAMENLMPIKVGERVSVYISIPVPLK